MSDNRELKGPQDRKRVSLGEDYEVRYWTNRFNCSKEELERAVAKVGNSVEKIEKELSGK